MFAMALALVVLFGIGTAAAEPSEFRRLTPAPAPTAVVPHWTPLASALAPDKPLPKPFLGPAPRLPSSLSAPVVAPPQRRTADNGTTTPAAMVFPPPEPAGGGRTEGGRTESGHKDGDQRGAHKDLAAPHTAPLIRYAATEINVRPRPDQDARRSDVIDEGTRLEVIGPLIQNEWVKVARHGHVLGYVSADYLLPHPPRPH